MLAVDYSQIIPESATINNTISTNAHGILMENYQSFKTVDNQNREVFPLLQKSLEDEENQISKSFSKAFLLPEQYLPKNKRLKLEKTCKKKLPAAGTSDEWVKFYEEKEKKRLEIKQLQDEKKVLADEAKKKATN